MAAAQCRSVASVNARPTRAAPARRHVAQAHRHCVVRATAGNGATAAVSPALLEVMQNVANGVLTASDAALQLNQLVSKPPSGAGPAESAVATQQAAQFPEVVWGADKGAGQILTALQRIAEQQGMAAATRVSPETAAEVIEAAPEAVYHPAARMLVLKSSTTKQRKLPGSVALICAGTADTTVVEECRLMLASSGCYAFKLAESGVMGMHRIVQNLEAVKAADVVICITGMDGGLASVVAGMVEVPVIALPTSTGYGTAFAGVAPLLAALNSSAPGVTVVNIDSGFGASMAAWRILKNAARIRQAVAAAAAKAVS